MLNKEKLFPRIVKRVRLFGLRLFNIGGRVRQDSDNKK